MAHFINTIEALGDDVVMDGLITRTITEFRDNNITRLRYGAFRECRELRVVDMPNLTYLNQAVFANCVGLKALILRGNTMCTNINPDILSGSAIASDTGYIYVPRALIEDYKVATNWSIHADQFRALEDYTVDGTITGELDESKI